MPSFPINFKQAPSYSIPSQLYPSRVSPDRTERTARSNLASSKSPFREATMGS